jgi:hypothetical protein
MIIGYEEALANSDAKRKPSGKATEPIRFVLKQALKRKWIHLAEERIEDVKPSIPLGKCFWMLTEGEKRDIFSTVRFGRSSEAHDLTTTAQEQERSRRSRCLVLDEGVQLSRQATLCCAG